MKKKETDETDKESLSHKRKVSKKRKKRICVCICVFNRENPNERTLTE